MNREEAIALTIPYLAQLPIHEALDNPAIVASLTDYTACWYADFHYLSSTLHLPDSNGAPGFVIDKKNQQIRVISWLELYELNCEPLLF